VISCSTTFGQAMARWVETASVTGPEQSWNATGLAKASATVATFLAKVSPPPQVTSIIECAIVVQMACVHGATMAVLGRLSEAYGHRNVLAAATAASRLSRTFAILVETLRRLRSGGSQVIRIERVEVSGGQAVIGNIKTHRSEPNE
jgi:hypothetical protein